MAEEELIEQEDETVEAEEIPEGPSEEEIQAQEEARKYGWRPKEEFDLAPEGWVDAKRFMELPSTQNKMLRDELRELRNQTSKAEETFAERLERLDRANRAAMEAALRKQQEEHEAKLAELTQTQRRAAEEGDMATYDAIERQKASLKPPEPVQTETPQTEPKNDGPDPEVVSYREKNEWTQDPVLWKFAADAVSANPDILRKSAKEQLEYAEARVKDLFPHKFEQPRARPSRVDGGGLAGGRKSGKGASDLPSEARAAGQEFVEAGVFKTMDDYAKAYFGDEA